MGRAGDSCIFWGIILFFVFLVTGVYALLNMFVFNNFSMDIFFMVGILTIIPSIILIIIGLGLRANEDMYKFQEAMKRRY
jgi:hypothetical protein